MQSKATTVAAYLKELEPERRAAISNVRDVILNNLPKGYKEVMQYGMISYVIPLEDYPNTYNGQPLCIVSLASQKNYMALYVVGPYTSKETYDWFMKEYKKSGKKLDMGKSCIRFKTVDDLALPVIEKLIQRVTPKDFIAQYEASRT